LNFITLHDMHTFGRSPLDEGSARRTDTTINTKKSLRTVWPFLNNAAHLKFMVYSFRFRSFEVLQRTYSCTHVAIIIQHDATACSLFISVNCSTFFGWYLRPSSGAHCIYSIWH